MQSSEYRALAAATMSENELLEQVRTLAHQLGWRLYHTRDSRGSYPGFPDLVLVRDRVLFRELKSQRGAHSQEQKHWISQLHQAGADVGTWRPQDLIEGRIRVELDRHDLEYEHQVVRLAKAICVEDGESKPHQVTGHGACLERARRGLAVIQGGETS